MKTPQLEEKIIVHQCYLPQRLELQPESWISEEDTDAASEFSSFTTLLYIPFLFHSKCSMFCFVIQLWVMCSIFIFYSVICVCGTTVHLWHLHWLLYLNDIFTLITSLSAMNILLYDNNDSCFAFSNSHFIKQESDWRRHQEITIRAPPCRKKQAVDPAAITVNIMNIKSLKIRNIGLIKKKKNTASSGTKCNLLHSDPFDRWLWREDRRWSLRVSCQRPVNALQIRFPSRLPECPKTAAVLQQR